MGSICSMSKWGKWGTEIFPQLWKFGTKGINKNLLQFVTPLYQGLNFLNLISSCFLRNFLQLTHPIVKKQSFCQFWRKKLYLTSIRSGRKKLYLSQVLLDFRHGLTKKIVLDFCKDLKKTKIVLDFHQERWSTWLDLWDLLWGDARRRHKLQYWRDFKYRGMHD